MTHLSQHRWVKHVVTPIAVIPDPENDAEVFAIEDPVDVAQAEDRAVYGCDVCGVPLDGNSDTLCDPACRCGAPLSAHGFGDNHDFKEAR